MAGIDKRRDEAFALLVQQSHLRFTGRPLHPGAPLDASALYAAPFCLLAHDAAADPRFTYANAAALQRFEYS